MKSESHSISGFTLLEIMIALAIIGTALTVILHTVNFHSNIMYENVVTTNMYQIAKEKMHDLETSRKSSKGVISGTAFRFENRAMSSEESDIIELRTSIYHDDRKVTLKQLVLKEK